MRRLLTLILLLVALPAGAGLFDSRPGASLGGGLDGGDFLKVDQAFKPSVERCRRASSTTTSTSAIPRSTTTSSTWRFP